jgi:hypothetical protein
MTSSEIPTIFHITHWKAGSQWIRKILFDCVPELVVEPQRGVAHFLASPIQKGKVYPTVYVTKEQFHSIKLPPEWRRFIIIRDLRDTLVSAYFSVKLSHPILSERTLYFRTKLDSLNIEEGLLFLIKEWLPACAAIQKTWCESNEPLIRYEDLLINDLAILEKTLIDDCKLPVSRVVLKEAVLANRFESMTKGRSRGNEDIMAHQRKGIAGDWRNYFSEVVKKKFKDYYGDLLLAFGYEHDYRW